jgi:hypothetical protein
MCVNMIPRHTYFEYSVWVLKPGVTRIKEVPRLGRVEFKAIAEIFFGSRVLFRHKGPAFRASRSDAVATATWQAITSWSVATRVSCRTPSTTSSPTGRRINSKPLG